MLLMYIMHDAINTSYWSELLVSMNMHETLGWNPLQTVGDVLTCLSVKWCIFYSLQFNVQ